ncbi:iron(III) transport system substrate-binding protein [Marmoricola sp. OAE513]|uniref:iron ABC transporter substrate-binding protein n=1 Tax=Marmoricola sp. OAE513 TaxID=2817894 RepID=UPI001D6160B5
MVSRPRALRALVAVAAAALALPALAACGGGDDDKNAVVVYNAQHEELIDAVAKAFTKKTGIEVKLRNGSDLELANQLVAEGKASPADVFLTENSPAMALVDSKDLFEPLDATTLDRIPAQYRPADGHWTGFAGRSTVLVYNKAMVKEADLPTSLLDLADPKWKGKVSFSPTGADFQAIVAGVLALKGEAATKAWLEGIKANGTTYKGNNVVLQSVNAGEVATGIIYHYYWYRDQEEAGDNSNDSALHFFGNADPGAFVSTSGAGVLENGKHGADAKKFVDYLTSKEGQQIIADSYALEYTLNPEVPLGRDVKPFGELQPPSVGISDLDSKKVVELMQDADLL